VSDLEIRQTRFGAPAAQQLVAAAQADLAERYGSGDENPIEAIEFDPPEGCFLVGWLAGEPVACGGWRTLAHFAEGDAAAAGGGVIGPEQIAEIKRMYVAPSARGTGVAAELLSALIETARAAGMRRMVLETGLKQPEAIRFYEKHGFTRIKNYGYYRDAPDCVSFAIDL